MTSDKSTEITYKKELVGKKKSAAALFHSIVSLKSDAQDRTQDWTKRLYVHTWSANGCMYTGMYLLVRIQSSSTNSVTFGFRVSYRNALCGSLRPNKHA